MDIGIKDPEYVMICLLKGQHKIVDFWIYADNLFAFVICLGK